MATQNQSQNHGSGTLNVLLHGAFTFVRDSKNQRIFALIPALKHAYRAGSWLGETELRPGSYKLTGVVPGGFYRFDPNKNLIVNLTSGNTDSDPIITLEFRYPKNITSLRVAKAPTRDFSGSVNLLVPDPSVKAKPTQHMSTLQIFTYDIEDENALALKADNGKGNHYWEPAFTGEYVNLHIFSSEDSYHKPSNALEDFNECLKLLGVELKLDTRFLPAREIQDRDPPPGVAPEETEVLALRTRRMAQLGRLVIQKADANLAWYGVDALDGDPTACADCVAYLPGP